jgi:uncharacterized protein YcfJ
MTTLRTLLVVLVALFAAGCAHTPNPYGGVGYSYGQAPAVTYDPYPYTPLRQIVCPGQAIVASNGQVIGCAPLAPVGYVTHNGGVPPQQPQAATTVSSPAQQGAAQLAASGLRPDQARAMRQNLEAMSPSPCSTRDGFLRSAVGAVIGGLVGSAVGNSPGAAIGALLGIVGGNASASMSCQNWHDLRMALLVVEGGNRCTVQTGQTYASATGTNEVAGQVQCIGVTPYESTVSPPQVPTYGRQATAPRPAPAAPPASRWVEPPAGFEK